MSRIWGIIVVPFIGMGIYILVLAVITPGIQALYASNPIAFFAPSHFNDARQYVFICNQGYNVPFDTVPTIGGSRISWMPVYALLQCGLHHLIGISLVYTGVVISTLAIGITLFLGVLTLTNLGIHAPAIHTFAALTPLVGAIWLYLPSAEATFLVVGMIVMWLITLPPLPDAPRERITELLRVLLGMALGVIFILTKPNALALLLPLIFAFLYRSWQRSCAVGYPFNLWTFTADVIIEHVQPLFRRSGRIELERRPIHYDWTALAIVVGIILGFAGWMAYSSIFSGIPFYFLQQQLDWWKRGWRSGNLIEMMQFFAQAFQGIDASKPWRYSVAWDLAANLTALIPAVSLRVPSLIRGMLLWMVAFTLFSGTAGYGSDRYILSTALVAVGWGCWLAPTTQRTLAPLRWLFVISMAVVTSYLLIGYM